MENIEGITLRDYFAAAALQVMTHSYVKFCEDEREYARAEIEVGFNNAYMAKSQKEARLRMTFFEDTLCRKCYKLADAMLKIKKEK